MFLTLQYKETRLALLGWPQIDGLDWKSKFNLQFLFAWLEWSLIISPAAFFNRWHLPNGSSFWILSCMKLDRAGRWCWLVLHTLQNTCDIVTVCVNAFRCMKSSLFKKKKKNLSKENMWQMWEGGLLQPNINNITHFKVFPVGKTTLFYLWFVWQADRDTFSELHTVLVLLSLVRVCVCVCRVGGGRKTKSETDLSFLHQ